MTKNITQDNLIRYIYHETSAEEAMIIEETLQSDFELKELYSTLLESKAELDRIHLEPSQKVVDNILRYSKDNAPMEHHH